MTCPGVASMGTPTTRVRGTMISLAVRSAKEKRPCTSSGEGAPGAPPRASSVRILSISCSGGGGGGGLGLLLEAEQPAGAVRALAHARADLVLSDGDQRGVGRLQQRAAGQRAAGRQEFQHDPYRTAHGEGGQQPGEALDISEKR